MVDAQTVLESVATALHDSDRLPDETTYATLELDPGGAQADVQPPVVELTLQELARDTTSNTEFVGYETDSNGNRIGRRYQSWFRLQVQLDCLSADGSEYDAREMGQQVREALRRYDTRQLGRPLPNPDGSGGNLYAVRTVAVENSSRPNDLSMTPTLRRTRTNLSCWFKDEYSSVDYDGPADYIEDYSISTTVYSP